MQNVGKTPRTVAIFAFCILHLALLGCAKTPPAAAPSHSPIEALQRDILTATRSAGVQRASWGVIVHSLDRNDRLFELNPRSLLVPASAAKLITVASAAEAVGWDYRYETAVRSNGPIVDGALRGDLFVVGSGDPSIGGRSGEDLSGWIAALKTAGIQRIDGRIIGDDNAIEEPRPQLAWAWDDLGYTFGSIFGALNLGENRMEVTVSPGPSPGTPAVVAVAPEASYRPLANRAVTGAAGSTERLWPEQRPGEAFLTIAGSVPAGGMPARVSVSSGNPTFWFASVFRNQLLRSGIEVTGDAWDIDDVHPAPGAAATVLHIHRSAPLSEIAQPLLKSSINLYAEALLRLNARPPAFPTNDAALAGLQPLLAAWGVPADAQQLFDGSGLSRRNVVSPEALLIVLQRMHDASGTSPFVRALPVAGVDGTLSSRMRGTAAEQNVRAKTGSMSNIRSLAGYVTTRDGERLAFVVMVNNFEGAAAAAHQAIDTIAVRLAGFSRH